MAVLQRARHGLIESYLLDCNIEQAAKRIGVELEFCESSPSRWYYVYALIDPLNSEIFYIGKGHKLRWQMHGIEGLKNGRKWLRINKIRRAGKEYRAIYLARGLTSSVALATERQIIGLIGIDRLTNIRRGSTDRLLREAIECVRLIGRLKRNPQSAVRDRIINQVTRALGGLGQQMAYHGGA